MNLEKFTPIGQISASQMIAEIRASNGVPFSMIWVRANDKGKAKPKGQLIFKAQLLYGGAEREITTKAMRKDAEARDNAQFSRQGLLPVHDYETNEFYTPLIGLIMFFNGKRVNH